VVDGAQSFPEFEPFAADPALAPNEAGGYPEWTGGNLEHIAAEDGVKFLDIPSQLKELAAHCWTAGTKPQGPRAGGIGQVGGGQRLQHIPNKVNDLKRDWKPQSIFEAHAVAERNQAYNPQVRPLTCDSTDSVAPAALLSAVPGDWALANTMQRVSAYTFRGDTRGPAAIAAANGFFPPISRTDDHYVKTVVYPQFSGYLKRRFGVTIDQATFYAVYHKKLVHPADRAMVDNFFTWRSLVERESHHVGRFLGNEALKGLVSTSRAAAVAKGYAKDGGWVYLTLVRGGFLVPEKGKHEWTAIFGEQEVASLGAIPWQDIFGFRQVQRTRGLKFAGPIYLRKGFAGRNSEAFRKALRLLGGEVQ